jgi:hypothetical protein
MKSRIQNSESRSQNDKAETALTDAVFLFFWILNSEFCFYEESQNGITL